MPSNREQSAALNLEEASVCRIWRTEIVPARAADYEEFTRTTSTPMFRQQQGFVGVLFVSCGAERCVITLWRDLDSVERLSESESYAATVKQIEAAGLLRGRPTVEVFVLDGYSDAARRSVAK